MKRISDLASLDLYDEDGYREWTKRAQGIYRELMNEMSFTGDQLFQILRATPVSSPRSGIMSAGDDSKHYARKVRGYLRRAAQASEFAGAQVTGAFAQFEKGFVIVSGSGHKGMNINRKGA